MFLSLVLLPSVWLLLLFVSVLCSILFLHLLRSWSDIPSDIVNGDLPLFVIPCKLRFDINFAVVSDLHLTRSTWKYAKHFLNKEHILKNIQQQYRSFLVWHLCARQIVLMVAFLVRVVLLSCVYFYAIYFSLSISLSHSSGTLLFMFPFWWG